MIKTHAQPMDDEGVLRKAAAPVIDLLSHPFFNWKWSVVDVALIFVLVYTFR